MRKSILRLVFLCLTLGLSIFAFSTHALMQNADHPVVVPIFGDTVYESNRYSMVDDLTVRDDQQNIETSSTGIETDFAVRLKAGDVLIDQNDRFELYFNAATLIFKLKNLTTGYLWASAFEEISPENSDAVANRLTSPVWIEYFPYNENTDKYAETVVEHNVKGSIRVTGQPRRQMASVEAYVEAGVVTLWIDFLIAEITFPIQVSLDEFGLRAFVPTSQIEEGKHLLSSITLFPTFGATVSDNVPGYVVIPDGPGALYRFKDNTGTLQVMLNERYFGANLGLKNKTSDSMSQLTAPIFGIVHGHRQDAMYVAIEEGATNAALLFNPSGASNVNYNYATNKYYFRENYIYPTSLKTQTEGGGVMAIETIRHDEDIRVNYRFVENTDATAIGIANHYREELIQSGVLSNVTKQSQGVVLEYVMVEAKSGLFGPSTFAIATFGEIEKSIQSLLEQGQTIDAVILKGWSKGGLSVKMPYETAWDVKTGGKSAFAKLKQRLDEHGIELVLHTDYAKTLSGSRVTSSAGELAQGLHRMNLARTIESPMFTQQFYLNPSFARERFASDLKWFQAQGVDAIAFDTIGNTLFSYVEDGVVQSRADHAKQLAALVASAEPLSSYVYRPNQYLWTKTTAYLSFPVFHAQYTLYDDTVPFLATILRPSMRLYGHAYNLSTNLTELSLIWMDHGIAPLYTLTTRSTYMLKQTHSWRLSSTLDTIWRSTLQTWEANLDDGTRSILTQALVDRVVPVAGLVVNTYADGTTVYINYTGIEIEYNGISIPAKSCVWTVV